MKSFFFWTILFPILLSMISLSCSPTKSDENKLRDFITNHLKVIEPKLKAMNLADWNANLTGDKKFYDERAVIELEVNTIRSNKSDFAFLKDLKEKGTIKDSLLQRQLTILFNQFAKNQIDITLMKQIVDKQAEIASKFNTFRGRINGKEVNDNEIADILKNERNSAKRKLAWEVSKQVGREVAPMVIELVKLRNQAAKQLGFENYYVMSLATDEQNADEVIAIFDNLKQLTDEPFRQMKQVLDTSLAKRFGVKVQDIKPWHYANPFFQEVSEYGEADLDKYFKGKNIEEISRTFFAGIDLPVDDILKNSDLYPRKGKYQHAFCNDIDRLGDVRIMCNLADNLYWMDTQLHELGHAVYSKYVNKDLPFLIRTDAHTFMTEAIAQIMGRQAYNVDWLQTMVGINEKEKPLLQKALRDNKRISMLAFSRWSQVMVRFERALYQNPDQDLNKLWWDFVEEYQFVKRPEKRNESRILRDEPDWAAKIHVTQYPCYYHNYQLGELAASQILNTIIRDIIKQQIRPKGRTEISFAAKPDIGKFLKEKIFVPGSSYYWNDLLKNATGEGLTPKYFVEEFVK
ncbi:MAG: M2 family metallopeptidase [Bacteroidetes bacterium]|nr:M2 family metallopeptidase [Bacteroidota bacterium]